LINRRLTGAILAALAAAGCGGRGAHSGRVIPAQIVIEFGAGPAAVPEALAPRLATMGVKSFFVPAVRARAEGASVQFEKLPAPSAPYPLPVYLEVSGVGDFDPYFRLQKERAADAIWRNLAAAASSSAYGKIQGVHLALRVSRSGSEYAQALAALRKRMKGEESLSAGVYSNLDEESRKGWNDVVRRVDFLVPVIFGRVRDTDPEGFRVSASLKEFSSPDTPVCAGFSPQGWGVVKSASSQGPQTVPDILINDLSEDRRFEFSFGSILTDEDENVYIFTARQSVSNAGWGAPMEPNDSVTFRERRISDLTAALAGARFASAKVVQLDSLDDQDHLIGFSVLEDMLLGRPLDPRLVISRSGTPGNATVMALNAKAEFSELSRIGNWIDVRVENAQISDVRPGDFDRFEYLDEEGKRAVAARARTIRFYENFVAPGESMTAGPIHYTGQAKFFGSFHITLPDGRTTQTPEAEMESFPEASQSAPKSAQPGHGRAERAPRRKR
jgi:hypothetical protein